MYTDYIDLEKKLQNNQWKPREELVIFILI